MSCSNERNQVYDEKNTVKIGKIACPKHTVVWLDFFALLVSLKNVFHSWMCFVAAKLLSQWWANFSNEGNIFLSVSSERSTSMNCTILYERIQLLDLTIRAVRPKKCQL